MKERTRLAIVVLLLVGIAKGATLRVPGDHETIQGAIDAAETGDLVLVWPGSYREHEIDFLGKAITVSGIDPLDQAIVDSTVVNGSGDGSVFVLHSGEVRDTRLVGVTVTGGRAEFGAGISCIGTSATLVACSIRGNGAGYVSLEEDPCGAGVYCEGGAPFFMDCTIAGNHSYNIETPWFESDAFGGGVCAIGGSPVFVRCGIRENSAGSFTFQTRGAGGGGVALFSGAMAEFRDCDIVENTADNYYMMGNAGAGAGIYGEASSLTLIRCVVSNNILAERGSTGGIRFRPLLRLVSCEVSENDDTGIYAVTDTLEVFDSVVRGHDELTRRSYHGGIGWGGKVAWIDNSIISHNRSEWNGGGLNISASVGALVESCRIVGNKARECGGGVFASGTVTIRNCVIDTNIASRQAYTHENGGAVYVDQGGSVLVEDCELGSNLAAGSGGGLYIDQARATLNRCELLGNGAHLRGGAIYADNGTLLMSDSDTRACTSTYGAAAFYATAGTLSVRGSIIAGNRERGRDDATIGIANAEATLENCTIADNSSDWAVFSIDESGSADLTNCILWANDAPELVHADTATVSIRYSDLSGGWPGVGNIDADPLFRSWGRYDYLLDAGSPAIDAGAPSRLDAIYDSHPRWPKWHHNGERSDMGAYGGGGSRGWWLRRPAW